MSEKHENREVALQLTGVKKMYKLGQIGGGTLQGDLQSWWARIHGREDPNSVIGQEQRLVGTTFMALNGIDLTVYKGEALGIIGANGAGKSTMLKLLSRVTAPTEGEIDIYGRIASMLEVGTGFNGEMTGRENVYMNGAILGMTKAEIDAKMEQIIDFSEVRDFIDTPVKRYSSGMYVKLAFSVAAHLDSEIMIMDEVLAVGDMAFQKKCLTKMREAANREGRTVLYVSHNMNTIRQLCDRCIVLDKGRIAFDGNVEEAIEVYMHSLGRIKADYKYTKEYHSNRRSNDTFVIQSLSIDGGKDPVCEYGEHIFFDLSCFSRSYVSQVFFRFETRFQDDTIVGTLFTNKGIDFRQEEFLTMHMIMDTAHLSPGRYLIDIVAYRFNEYGHELFLDGVYPGMMLEITDTINEGNKLYWQYKYWGHVHLHDILVTGISEKENA